jgi:hypothetical protein
MGYFDGKRWYHIWCTVNEGIAANLSADTIYPSRWKFLGSNILSSGSQSITIKSSHEVTVSGVPLRIKRGAYFTAGETYFVLTIKITNIGDKPARFYYVYGDEPWLGHYGSSAGNIGWLESMTTDYETIVPPTFNFAGLYDHGNETIGEGHAFSNVANFIEWLGPNRPAVYFSNTPGKIDQKNIGKYPLSSNTRFLGLEWGPRTLNPKQSESYTLAIGMAGNDPKTGFPAKPEVKNGRVYSP